MVFSKQRDHGLLLEFQLSLVIHVPKLTTAAFAPQGAGG